LWIARRLTTAGGSDGSCPRPSDVTKDEPQDIS